MFCPTRERRPPREGDYREFPKAEVEAFVKKTLKVDKIKTYSKLLTGATFQRATKHLKFHEVAKSKVATLVQAIEARKASNEANAKSVTRKAK